MGRRGLLSEDNKLIECLNRYANVLKDFADVYMCGKLPGYRWDFSMH